MDTYESIRVSVLSFLLGTILIKSSLQLSSLDCSVRDSYRILSSACKCKQTEKGYKICQFIKIWLNNETYVRCVGDQFSNEDFFVGIECVDD